MVKHPKSLILICLIVGIASILLLLLAPRQTKFVAPTPTPRVIKVAQAQESKTEEVGSPDGKWALKRINDTFTMVDLTLGTQKVILEKQPVEGVEISIPLNTFSPTDKYVFLKETSPAGIKYFVYPGENVEITGLFKEKYPEYVITDVTGWGGYTQIVINTDKVGGGTGPSIWFDASSHSFYKLSTRFN